MGYFEIGGPSISGLIITLRDGTKVDLIEDAKAAKAGDKAAQDRMLRLQRQMNEDYAKAHGTTPIPVAATWEEEIAAQIARVKASAPKTSTSTTSTPGTSLLSDDDKRRIASGTIDFLTDTPPSGQPPSGQLPVGPQQPPPGAYPQLPYSAPSMFTPEKIAIIAGGVGLLAIAGYVMMTRKKTA